MSADVGWTLVSLSIQLVLVLLILWVARHQGFFRYGSGKQDPKITLWDIAGVFLVQWVSLWLLSYLLSFFRLRLGMWVEGAAPLVVLPSVLLYCHLRLKKSFKLLFWPDGEVSLKIFLKNLFMGFIGWGISAPLVIVWGMLLSLIFMQLSVPIEDQFVVQYIRDISHFGSFFFIIFIVVLVVPFLEEFLFRGILQTWLRQHLGKTVGLIVTAAIFSALHFVRLQGWANLTILTSLFLFSLFLGLLYERQRSLWAPITCHALFNGFNTILLTMPESYISHFFFNYPL